MRSIIAASVVDLPLPVGPVTRTSPWVRKQSFWTSGDSPSSSTDTTFPMMTRKTAIGPFRSRAVLQRKRATSGMSKAQSESPVTWNSSRSFCSMVLSIMSSISRASSGGRSRRTSSPSLRTSGGSPVRRWRSEPPASVVYRSNPSRVARAARTSGVSAVSLMRESRGGRGTGAAPGASAWAEAG